ncbi:MAG: nicotinate-nucleotide--dimethylbenzimidazole phosphoribosyltransferase, partial [Gammaproteobacteria bacterium]
MNEDTMIEWYLEPCAEISAELAEKAQQRQTQLTKPPGSLGQLEHIAIELSAMQVKLAPTVDRVEIAVFAGDHGIANESVSAFPQVVTTEMVKNFVRGGAAISVMARQIGAGLTVINAGTINQQGFEAPVVDKPVAFGTGNIAVQQAMTAVQCLQALSLGKEILDGYDEATDVVIGGEMGIGNTTSATALATAFGVSTAANLVGPGTGLDSNGVLHKLKMIEQALTRVGEGRSELELLSELGGFEIVALTGFYIRAAQRGMTILVDGFISTVAAAAACKINSNTRAWMLFSHNSAEPGHQLVLNSLNAEPLLSLQMRLGEGSGAAVALGLLRGACALHNEMAT